jgi:hypothetical protein
MGAARGVGPLPVLTGPLVAPAHGRRVRGMSEAAWGEDLGEVWWRGVRGGLVLSSRPDSFRVRNAHPHTAVSRSRSRLDAIVTRSGIGHRGEIGIPRAFGFRQHSNRAVSRMRMPCRIQHFVNEHGTLNRREEPDQQPFVHVQCTTHFSEYECLSE